VERKNLIIFKKNNISLLTEKQQDKLFGHPLLKEYDLLL